MLVGNGKLLDPARLGRIFVSPRTRAQKTFEILFENVTGQPSTTTTEDVAEWNYGDYEGLTAQEIIDLRKSRNLDLIKPWNIWSDGCESGESMQQVTQRLDRIISQIKTLHQSCMRGEEAVDVLIVC